MKCNKDNKVAYKLGKGAYWGYVRVSTDLQDIGKQKDIIKNWFRREGVRDYMIVQGGMVSSTKGKRERKLEFLDDLKSGDTLVCTEISRLSRSVKELLDIMDDLIRKNVKVVFISHNLIFGDFSNPFTKFALQMLSAFAEMERNLASQRTKEALRILKERGVKLGRRKGTMIHSIFDNHRDKIKEWCRLGFSYNSQARALGLSHTGLIHYVRTRSIFRNESLK